MNGPVRWQLQAEVLSLLTPGGERLEFALGARSLAQAHLRHSPPTALELEQAIETIENSLMAGPWRQAQGQGGELLSTVALPLPDRGAEAPAVWRVDEVEAAFQTLAAIALGRPGSVDAEAAATLLILRECMHHLGYGSIRVAST